MYKLTTKIDQRFVWMGQVSWKELQSHPETCCPKTPLTTWLHVVTANKYINDTTKLERKHINNWWTFWGFEIGRVIIICLYTDHSKLVLSLTPCVCGRHSWGKWKGEVKGCMSIQFSHTFIPPFLSVVAKYFKFRILFWLISLGVLKDQREGPLLQRIKIINIWQLIKFFIQKKSIKKTFSKACSTNNLSKKAMKWT